MHNLYVGNNKDALAERLFSLPMPYSLYLS
ncbi:hypothetical protein BRIN106911_12350 [Brevibacillus invocatus]